jgi:Asp/Glu/hydantoin racemase
MRITLLHAYRHSIPPIAEAFREAWPEVQALNLLDEALYADVTPEGVADPSLEARMRSLFRHCELSGSRAILVAGSTFGPIADRARSAVAVPVVKADEAAAEQAVSRGRRILLVCTAIRALPVIERNLRAAMRASGKDRELVMLCIPEAKQAIDENRVADHNRIIADRLGDASDFDVVMFGQMSMQPARSLLLRGVAEKLVTTPEAAVASLRRRLIG